MAVPDVAVILQVAVAVFVIQRRIVEIGMCRDGKREDTGLCLESDFRRVDAGRPDIGEDIGIRQRPHRSRFGFSGACRHGHVEDGGISVGRDFGVDDIAIIMN